MEDRNDELFVRPADALSQALSLPTPGCGDIPRAPRVANIIGDVTVELLLQPDGKVLAARALYGPPSIERVFVDFALRWTFTPLEGASRVRRTTLVVRYRRESAPFPWLKQ